MVSFINNKNFIYYKNLDSSKPKIAGFDLDHTIISPKHSIFPKDENDWKYTFSDMKEKILELSKDYNIVIFSNQKQYNRNSNIIISRINKFIIDLGIPVTIFLSINDDNYRKPNIGLWEFLETYIDTDKSSSFFVGDAAGRVYSNTFKDFSASDYKFALNVGIDFKTPQQLLNLPDNYKYIDIDTLPFQQIKTLSIDHFIHPQIKHTHELVILVGLPCVGKTTFKHKFFNSYLALNSDIKLDEKTLKNYIKKQNIIVDGCNHTIKKRKKILDIAKKNNVNVRCFYFNIDKQIALHLNNYSMKVYNTVKKNKISFTNIEKKMELPNIEEGFENIEFVNFVPIFTNPNNKKLFYQHS